MGGAVSTGVDNDDLINNLRNADYIRTSSVERVFRAVDRGEYILPEYRMNAYKDQAWRSNHLHLSAPCIYSEVMEGLRLAPGLSFLNLGSGTGYLSTMAGLIIGSTGINHGVEYYEDVIAYAVKKLEEFKKYSGGVDEFDFCEPKFMQGNCLCLTNDRQYDRVYVGAACPEPYDSYMKNLLRVGGILVMPFNEHLLQVTRTSECAWDVCSLLSVSFATLIVPKDGCKDTLELIDVEPQSLQSVCRSTIRNILRHNIDIEIPSLKNRKQLSPNNTQPPTSKKGKSPYIGNVVIPICEGIAPRAERQSEHDVREYLGFVLDRVVGDGGPVRNCVSTHFCTWEGECSDSSSDEATMETGTEERMDTSNEVVEQAQTQTQAQAQAQTSRQKFDSGIGDESQSDDVMSCQDDDDDVGGCKWRRISKTIEVESSSTSSSDDEDNTEDDVNPPVELNKRRIVESPYTEHMCNKIQKLPLPPILKDYLNFYRV